MVRFEVIETESGKSMVFDREAGAYVRFGYNNPPLYAEPEKPATEWGNPYAARGFAQKMEVKNPPTKAT